MHDAAHGKQQAALPCAPSSAMDALYNGYWGMGTSRPSRSSRMIAFSIMRTAGLAPSVRKMFCRAQRAAAAVRRFGAGCRWPQRVSQACPRPAALLAQWSLQSEHCQKGERMQCTSGEAWGVRQMIASSNAGAEDVEESCKISGASSLAAGCSVSEPHPHARGAAVQASMRMGTVSGMGDRSRLGQRAPHHGAQ